MVCGYSLEIVIANLLWHRGMSPINNDRLYRREPRRFSQSEFRFQS